MDDCRSETPVAPQQQERPGFIELHHDLKNSLASIASKAILHTLEKLLKVPFGVSDAVWAGR